MHMTFILKSLGHRPIVDGVTEDEDEDEDDTYFEEDGLSVDFNRSDLGGVVDFSG
jgi:hypothetical protein